MINCINFSKYIVFLVKILKYHNNHLNDSSENLIKFTTVISHAISPHTRTKKFLVRWEFLLVLQDKVENVTIRLPTAS